MPAPYDLYDYQSYWKNRQYEDQSERLALSSFLKKIGNREKIIDLGSGFGRLTSVYLDFFEKVVLCDPSEKNLALSSKKYSGFPKIDFVKASLPCLPFKNNCFDLVMVVRVFHHLKNSQPSLEEINRILKPGGFLILEFANKIHFLNMLKALAKLDFTFFKDLTPFEQRSEISLHQRKINFLNHHPREIENNLRQLGFEIKEKRSVSNFRNPIIKRIIPLSLRLLFEKKLQATLSLINFGPSIFVLAQKPIRLDF